MAKPAPAKAAPAKPAPDAGGAEVMSAAELKPLLVMSKREPVSCAIGMTKDKHGVVLLNRKVAPRKLLGELRTKARAEGIELDTASLRFGRAGTDGEADSGTVVFTVNKDAPGALRVKLLEKLKKAGFQKCDIRVDQSLEAEGGAEGAGAHHEAATQPGADPAAPATAAPAQPASTAAPGGDAPAMAGRLAGLLRRVAAAGQSAPPALAQLAGIARDALRAQDLARAGKACDGLERMLGAPQGGGAVGTGAAPVAGAGHGSPKWETGRKVWAGTRTKLRKDIDAALDEIAAHYHEENPALVAVKTRVERVMDQFDGTLEAKLGEVSRNRDAAAHAKLVREAEAVISRYRSFVAGEEALALLDQNPFHPLQVQKTLDTALSALAKVVEGGATA